jgi:hypothetical protein
MDPPFCEVIVLKLFSSKNIDNAASAGGAEFDDTLSQCKQGVILAATDVLTGVEVCSTLANNDLACIDFLATKALHAQALGITVATVTGAGRTFFMCHGSLPCRNVGDLDRG